MFYNLFWISEQTIFDAFSFTQSKCSVCARRNTVWPLYAPWRKQRMYYLQYLSHDTAWHQYDILHMRNPNSSLFHHTIPMRLRCCCWLHATAVPCTIMWQKTRRLSRVKDRNVKEDHLIGTKHHETSFVNTTIHSHSLACDPLRRLRCRGNTINWPPGGRRICVSLWDFLHHG